MNNKIIDIPDNMEFDKVEGGKIYLKEKDITLLKTWSDCAESYAKTNRFEYIGAFSDIERSAINIVPTMEDTYLLPEGYGKAVLALCQLLVCREVYRQGWKPDWEKDDTKYVIIRHGNRDVVGTISTTSPMLLSFQSREIRDTFRTNFKDLITEAIELL